MLIWLSITIPMPPSMSLLEEVGAVLAGTIIQVINSVPPV